MIDNNDIMYMPYDIFLNRYITKIISHIELYEMIKMTCKSYKHQTNHFE